ncbi:hypothetical protein UR09_02450 [Candidatus Nitromaritima sp. SCGC AAA799-A02]|nr:hypothetical protein UZ36_03295 [Candidatus Nitromaritima sp. SCGC AAA799-C22]KMP11846.1 hypothetical protein UR09_02450 [Candidatus Nitromaritima sp. SCGC AAA799-A02]
MNSQSTAPRYLYIFLDEGGNLDFSPKGTKYFTMTSVAMVRPFEMADPLDELKYDLIELGLDIEYFHASEDRQYVRNRVFPIIQPHLKNIQIDSLVVEKRKAGPALRRDSQFYPRMLGYLLKYPLERTLLNKFRVEDVDELIIVTDALPIKKKRKIIEKSIKVYLKSMLPSVRYRIMHHSSKSSMELQIADYCNWAIYRKWERGDSRAYTLIKGGIRSEFDIFAGGRTFYY